MKWTAGPGSTTETALLTCRGRPQRAVILCTQRRAAALGLGHARDLTLSRPFPDDARARVCSCSVQGQRWPCHLASDPPSPGPQLPTLCPGNRSATLPRSPPSAAFQHLPIYQDSATAVNPSTPWKGKKEPLTTAIIYPGLNFRWPFPVPQKLQLGAPWWEGFFDSLLFLTNTFFFLLFRDPVLQNFLLLKDLWVVLKPRQACSLGLGQRADFMWKKSLKKKKICDSPTGQLTLWT